MRLLFVVDDLSVTSGRNCQLRQLSGLLSRDEYEIHIATFADRRHLQESDFTEAQLHCLDHQSTAVSRMFELHRLADHLAPDIIHSWGYESHLPVAVSQFLKNKASIIYSLFCLPPRRLMLRRWLEEIYTSDPAIVTASHPSIASGLAKDGFDNPIRVVPNSIIETSSDHAKDRNQLLDLAGIRNQAAFLAGTVSSLEPRFRLKDLIWAADLIFCIRDDVHLLIFGYGNGEPALRHFLGKTEVASNVHFVDARQLSARDLTGLDAYWNGQLDEPNPTMMLTAMSNAVPVISVLGNETADAILPMRSALSTNFGARDEFARWTKYIIEQRQRGEALAAQGREHVKKKFSVQQMVDGFKDLYLSTQ